MNPSCRIQSVLGRYLQVNRKKLSLFVTPLWHISSPIYKGREDLALSPNFIPIYPVKGSIIVLV